MEMEYTCAWAVHRMSNICDKAGLWFTESERKAFGEMLGRRKKVSVQSFKNIVVGTMPNRSQAMQKII